MAQDEALLEKFFEARCHTRVLDESSEIPDSWRDENHFPNCGVESMIHNQCLSRNLDDINPFSHDLLSKHMKIYPKSSARGKV